MTDRIINDVVLDGEPKIEVERRPPIKLSGKPHIVICMPVGDKHTQTVLNCPEDQGGCGQNWAAPGLRIPALVPVQWALAHMNVVTPLNTTLTYLCEHGRLSAEARQIMTKRAIKLGAKYILYWDDDTLPPSLGLYTMHNWMERHPEAGAISGVYTTREYPNEPLIYTAHGEGAAWDFPMGPGAEPVPIFGAGAGYLLARVDAIVDTIERMKVANDGQELPIWADERTLPHKDDDPASTSRKIMWGHDIRFCHLLNKHDWPVYVHGQVLCTHLDIPTNQLFQVPHDAPGLKKQWRKNLNTEIYWDQMYSNEVGSTGLRDSPEMFERVHNEVTGSASVVELGCGTGVLASRLVGSGPISYRGFDISHVAVEICKTRFLDVELLDMRDIKPEHINDGDVVVATELMEHLDEHVFHKVVKTVVNSGAKKFIFTTPDDCMGPDEVSEHTALFNEELIQERLARYEDWSYHVTQADDKHLLVVMERR